MRAQAQVVAAGKEVEAGLELCGKVLLGAVQSEWGYLRGVHTRCVLNPGRAQLLLALRVERTRLQSSPVWTMEIR